MPVYAAFFLIVTLSSIGLPGLNGFVGEVLVLQGAFYANRTFGVVAALGMILSACYMLWMYQRVFLGPADADAAHASPDLDRREKLILVPLVLLMVWMGVYSQSFLRPMDASLEKALARVRQVQQQDFEIKEAARPQPGIPVAAAPTAGPAQP